MSTPILRVAVVEMEYFIALDVQRAVNEISGWDAAIMATNLQDTLDTAGFDIAVTWLSQNPRQNTIHALACEAQERGIVFASTITLDDQLRDSCRGWPIIDVPFLDEGLVEAIAFTAERLLPQRQSG